MDAFSEVLRAIKLDSAVYFHGEYSEPWCVEAPESKVLASYLAPGAEHLIIYHLLVEGQAYARVDGGEKVTLTAGDLVALPQGYPHTLGGGPCIKPLDSRELLPGLRRRGLEYFRAGGNGQTCQLICGYLACDPHLSQSFLGGLPPLIKVTLGDDPSGRWLEESLKFSVKQAADRRAGANAMLAMLSETLFAEVLRRYARQLPKGQTGWVAATRDAEVGKALTLIHNRHDHSWTVSSLAQEVGLSRTVFSERFRHYLGEPPMAYLTKWRLGLGARELTSSARSVAQIAYQVGYESEAAFNRAFSRIYGVPPARFRRQQADPSKSKPAVLA